MDKEVLYTKILLLICEMNSELGKDATPTTCSEDAKDVDPVLYRLWKILEFMEDEEGEADAEASVVAMHIMPTGEKNLHIASKECACEPVCEASSDPIVWTHREFGKRVNH